MLDLHRRRMKREVIIPNLGQTVLGKPRQRFGEQDCLPSTHIASYCQMKWISALMLPSFISLFSIQYSNSRWCYQLSDWRATAGNQCCFFKAWPLHCSRCKVNYCRGWSNQAVARIDFPQPYGVWCHQGMDESLSATGNRADLVRCSSWHWKKRGRAVQRKTSKKW